MANYIETARSNYFKVKDLEAFKLAVENYGEFEITHDDEDPSLIAILGTGESFPAYGWDDDGNELDKEFAQIVSEHLTDDSVFVVVGSGYEKMRYVTGWAYAIDSTGKSVYMDISEIYNRAEAEFPGKTVTLAEY